MSTLLRTGFFRLARNVSKYSEYKIQMGAVIVDKKPISVGFNKIKTHPVFNNPDVSIYSCIHAEVCAILNSGRRSLKGCSIYVYREHRKTGKPALARPCKTCYGILRQYGIRKIYYTTNSFPFFICEKL